MKKINSISRGLPWLMAIGLSGLVAACGGGGQSPILGAGVISPVIPPTVTVVSPLPNATGVANNTKVIAASFSKPMDPTTLTASSFSVACAGAPAISGGTVTPLAANNAFTLNLPAANLPTSAVCIATVTTAAKDSTGLALANNFAWQFTTSAAADNTAPTVTNTVNANGATGVAVNTKVGATFSEAMDPATITSTSFTLKQTLNSAAVTGTTSYSGVNAVFAPASALKANTQYTATVTTAAKDIAGNPMTAEKVWIWTTAAAADTTKPRVTDTIHANGALNVPVNTRVGATFSEALDPLTVTNATFTLKQKISGAAVAGTTSYSGVDAVFIPLVNLLPGTEYTATVKGDATGIQDLAGNTMAGDSSWSWTTAATATGDVTPPTAGPVNPANLATGVCTNKTINASFSEPMDPLTLNNATFTLKTTGGAFITGLVNYDAPSKIATFNPTASLPAGNYTATLIGGVNGVKDLNGNAMAADSAWTFDVAAGTCVSAPDLGTASSFGGFGGNATLTNDGLNTLINGDIGVNAASTKITGLRDRGGNVYTVTTSNDGTVNGLIYTLTAPPGSVAGAAVTQARIDALVAFNAISPANMPGGVDVSSLAQCPTCGGALGGADELAGRTLPPGVYLSTTGTYDIGGATRTVANLTLDAGGDTNAVWVFQTSALTGTLNVGLTGPATPAVPIQVMLVNGAQAKNVFWYVPGGATIGTGATMAGTLLADASISFSTTGGTPPTAVRTTLNGRALALTAGVTMTNTVINVPAK